MNHSLHHEALKLAALRRANQLRDEAIDAMWAAAAAAVRRWLHIAPARQLEA